MLLAGVVIVTAFAVWRIKGKTMKTKDTPQHETEIVRLPQPRVESGTSVEKALLARRSVRDYQDEPLTLPEISQLLWAAQGVTSPGGFRAAPSAGALYPLETYIVAGNVTGIATGVYRYLPHQHALVLTAPGDRRVGLSAAAFHQASIRKAPASLVFSAVFARTTGKYGKRGHRYVYMENGHVAENVYLQTASLNLGTVVIGAFDDDAVKKVISFPPEEEPLSIMPIGKPVFTATR
jgi:SagB-type dehydrogenase family enzyme